MIEPREGQERRAPARAVKVRGITIPSAVVRLAQAVRLLPPTKSSREWDRVRRIAYL